MNIYFYKGNIFNLFMGVIEYITHSFKLLGREEESAIYVKENITWLGALLVYFVCMVITMIPYGQIGQGSFTMSFMTTIGIIIGFLTLFTLISMSVLKYFLNSRGCQISFTDTITIFYSVGIPFLFINLIIGSIPVIGENSLVTFGLLFWELYILIFAFKTAYNIPEKEADKAVGYWFATMFISVVVIGVIIILIFGLPELTSTSSILK